jgi:prepilin-type processing-associated H-X9-DG protein
MLIVGLIVAVLLPLVFQRRGMSRRVQCDNNFRLLALALSNYTSEHGFFPPGGLSYVDAVTGRPLAGFSLFVHMTPYLDQVAAFSAVNFDVDPGHLSNVTIAGLGISTLWCPDDPSVSRITPLGAAYRNVPSGPWGQAHTSYAGVAGTWATPAYLSDPNFQARRDNHNGVIFNHGAIRPSDVLGGMSNTIALAEHAHGSWPSWAGRDDRHPWNSGDPADTLVSSYHGINSHKFIYYNVNIARGREVFLRATNIGSMHAGGANVAMCDGSVKFLKDMTVSWPIAKGTNDPVGVVYDPAAGLYVRKSGFKPGVLQALTTRAGGD